MEKIEGGEEKAVSPASDCSGRATLISQIPPSAPIPGGPTVVGRGWLLPPDGHLPMFAREASGHGQWESHLAGDQHSVGLARDDFKHHTFSSHF